MIEDLFYIIAAVILALIFEYIILSLGTPEDKDKK